MAGVALEALAYGLCYPMQGAEPAAARGVFYQPLGVPVSSAPGMADRGGSRLPDHGPVALVAAEIEQENRAGAL